MLFPGCTLRDGPASPHGYLPPWKQAGALLCGRESCATTWFMPQGRAWAHGLQEQSQRWPFLIAVDFPDMVVFPDYQYLLVCSQRSLETTQETGVNVVRLQQRFLQAGLQQERLTHCTFLCSLPKALQEYRSSQGCPELL